MKRLFMVIMSTLMLLTAGCGSEVAVFLPIPVASPPSIITYHHSQDVVNRFVDGSVEFYAPDFDLDTITVSITNSRGVLIEETVTTLAGYEGRTTGTISFTIDYLNYRPDDYNYTIYLTDTAGFISNPVYGSFRV